MNRRTLSIHIIEMETAAELGALDEQLLSEALQAAKNAYTPYSQFNVGAAVRLSNGSVFTGSNQENAAFPSGLCAERTALFYAQALHPLLAVEAVAVAALPNGVQTDEPVYPCGACRQVMLESQKRAGKPIRVIMGGALKIQMVERIDDLLPLAFEEF